MVVLLLLRLPGPDGICAMLDDLNLPLVNLDYLAELSHVPRRFFSLVGPLHRLSSEAFLRPLVLPTRFAQNKCAQNSVRYVASSKLGTRNVKFESDDRAARPQGHDHGACGV
jgi:hypothetical protein